MATIGLRDAFFAKAIMSGSDIIGYEKPVRVAKAITVGLSINTAQATLYADDSIAEEVREFASGELSVNLNTLLPEIRALLLGQQVDEDGVVYATEGDDAPYGAFGFRADKTRGATKVVWLKKVKFGVPSENYGTKGSTVTFNTPTIVGTIMKDDHGIWKVDFDGLLSDLIVKTWFDQVREWNGTPSEPTEPTDPEGVDAMSQINGTTRSPRNTAKDKDKELEGGA